MRMQIIGYEINSGVSKRTGRPYDMSKIHTIIPLQTTDKAKGCVGTSYDCPAEVLEQLQTQPISIESPLLCDIQMQDVQQYGQRVQKIVSITPVTPAKKAA